MSSKTRKKSGKTGNKRPSAGSQAARPSSPTLASLLNGAFALSGGSLAALLMTNCPTDWLRYLSILTSIAILSALAWKFDFVRRTLSNSSWVLLTLAAVASLAELASLYVRRTPDIYYPAVMFVQSTPLGGLLSSNTPARQTELVLSVLAFFSLFVFLCWFYAQMARILGSLWQGRSRSELLYAVLVICIAIPMFLTVYGQTRVFYAPVKVPEPGRIVPVFDVVLGADTVDLVTADAYNVIDSQQNDFRQPLFAIFAAPVTAPLFLISAAIPPPWGYPLFLGVTQVLLLILVAILVSRLLELKAPAQLPFLLAFSVTFPFLLFALNLDQYVFATMWLVVLVYSLVMRRSEAQWLYSAAVGSLVISAVLLPFIAWKPGESERRIRDAANALLIFGGLFVVSGRLQLLTRVKESTSSYIDWTGVSLTVTERVTHYLSMVAACFVAPKVSFGIMPAHEGPSWFTLPSTNGAVLGLVILLMAITGFVLNRKSMYAQICLCWVALSFMLVGVLAYGGANNNFALYSLYFSWAYISLIAMLLKKALVRLPAAQAVAWSATAVVLAIVNVPAVQVVVEFGKQFYPFQL